MLKIALYHKLGELCLDVLFNRIKRNFDSPKNIIVGNEYDRITICRSSPNGLTYMETYNNCIITHVYEGKYAGNNVTLFNFKIANGDMLMGCEVFGSILE